MTAKPETTFITAIHKPLAHELYHEKMHNPYRGGTPDVWYSGCDGDLWVEYKFVASVSPKSKAVVPDLSALQSKWLELRYLEHRNVAVILGIGRIGGVIYRDREWEVPLSGEQLLQRVVSRSEISRWILNQTGRVYGRSSEDSGLIGQSRDSSLHNNSNDTSLC